MSNAKVAAGLAACALALAACTAGDTGTALRVPLAFDDTGQPSRHFRNPHIADGVAALKSGQYQDASKAFNEALKDDPQNAYVHFLNALTYHLLYRAGEENDRDLAEVGYQQALQFDPNGWWASYGLGVLKMEEHDYRLAQNQFAQVLLIDRDNAGALLGLAVASYYTADFLTASAAIRRVLAARPDNPAVLRGAALIAAATGQRAAAKDYADRYAAAQHDAAASDFVRRRIADWLEYFGTAPPSPRADDNSPTRLQLAALGEPTWASGSSSTNGGVTAPSENVSGGSYGATVAAESARPDLPPGKAGPEVLIDATYIRSQDQLVYNKGVNLLHGLQLQYGYSITQSKNSLSGIPAYLDAAGGVGSVASFPFEQSIMRSLTLPTLTYSLNIFNSQEAHNEIVSRPTLIAQQGQPSSFFSGDELTIALAGQYGGNLNQLEVGVNVDVTPTLVTDDKVTLRVRIKRTAFDAALNGTFQQAVQTSNNYVNATVTLGYDQTVVLSGLTDREKSGQNDRTPLLSDIPGVQYFFKNQNSTTSYRTVVIMLTPRRPEMAQPGPAELGARALAEASAPGGAPAKPGVANAKTPPAEHPLPNVAELQQQWQRGGDRTFAPAPNLAAAFYHLKDNDLYRQLRAGDLSGEFWEPPLTFSEAIREDLSFLYF